METIISEGDPIVTVNPSWVACAFEKKPGRRELALLALLSPQEPELSYLALSPLLSSLSFFRCQEKGF